MNTIVLIHETTNGLDSSFHGNDIHKTNCSLLLQRYEGCHYFLADPKEAAAKYQSRQKYFARKNFCRDYNQMKPSFLKKLGF
jgi:hypothetical protein